MNKHCARDTNSLLLSLFLLACGAMSGCQTAEFHQRERLSRGLSESPTIQEAALDSESAQHWIRTLPAPDSINNSTMRHPNRATLENRMYLLLVWIAVSN